VRWLDRRALRHRLRVLQRFAPHIARRNAGAGDILRSVALLYFHCGNNAISRRSGLPCVTFCRAACLARTSQRRNDHSSAYLHHAAGIHTTFLLWLHICLRRALFIHHAFAGHADRFYRPCDWRTGILAVPFAPTVVSCRIRYFVFGFSSPPLFGSVSRGLLRIVRYFCCTRFARAQPHDIQVSWFGCVGRRSSYRYARASRAAFLYCTTALRYALLVAATRFPTRHPASCSIARSIILCILLPTPQHHTSHTFYLMPTCHLP